MMSGLPEGWVETKLGTVLQLNYGKSLPDKVRSGKGYPVYGSNGIIGNHNASLTNGETLIVGRKGSVGEVHYSAGPCSPIDTTYFIDDLKGMPFRYWFHFLKHLNLRNLNKSTAIPGLSREDAYLLKVSLPPLNEQKRIADKLDALLARVDACRERLDRVPVILKRFRQAVLAAATSGGLTEEWRENHPSPGAPRHPLPKGEGTVLPTDVPPLHEREGRGEGEGLPEGWCISCVGKVSESLKYGTSQKCSYEKNGVPVIRIPNIGEGLIGHADLKFADLPDKEFQLLRLQPGDILVIRSNGSVSLVGKSALVREAEKDFAYAGYLIRIRPDQAKVLPEYLNLTLQSHKVRLQIEIPARSTSGVNNINSDELKALSFNLPPLPEQHEIVRRVETLFAFADRLEARYNAARKQVDNLTPSLLAKAFRGELVSQEERQNRTTPRPPPTRSRRF
jgi:type I restriction enzyme S subunit